MVPEAGPRPRLFEASGTCYLCIPGLITVITFPHALGKLEAGQLRGPEAEIEAQSPVVTKSHEPIEGLCEAKILAASRYVLRLICFL